MITAQSIHASLGDQGWLDVLLACGLESKFLRNKHGPCPICGGKDRFRFDNKGRGSFICNQCGAGDGFQLLMLVKGWDFSTARKNVTDTSGVKPEVWRAPTRSDESEIARPTARVRKLMRELCPIEDCIAARTYLESRALWPLPLSHALKAHPSVDYWNEGQKVGVFPAIISPVRDINGELVTVHVTYLDRTGQKLTDREPRKLLSGLVGREGCAVQLAPSTETLGIAEGVETALSAARLHGMNVWAALNTSLLARFIPPAAVKTLVIFADRDIAGLEAVSKLMQTLQGRVQLKVKTPQAKDWNDTLRAPNES